MSAASEGLSASCEEPQTMTQLTTLSTARRQPTAAPRGRLRAIGRVLTTAATVGGIALSGLLLAPPAVAGRLQLPVPREFAMEQVLNPKRCATAAENAGWRDDQLVIATAIALAESGCDPKAVGTNPPSGSCPSGSRDRGAWQINDCYHPSVSDACAFDLQCNADAAYDIYRDASYTFEPWTTWDTRQFKYFLDEARRAVKRLTGENIVVGVVTTEGGPLTIRKRHTTNSPATGSVNNTGIVIVKCQDRGESIYSPYLGYETRVWDKLAEQRWVANAYVYTDDPGWVGPRC